MKTATKKITTNSRVIKDILTRYRDTFSALCELINNSIQADAKNIEISIDYNSGADLIQSPIKSIVIKDDGNGVTYSEFEKKILDIGTTVKKGGQGIGRFGALQIGSSMEIETVGFDEEVNKYSRVLFQLNADDIQVAHVDELELKVDFEYLSEKINPYYKISIGNLYHGRQEKVANKNKIVVQLLNQNVRQAIFEKYPTEIFNQLVQFVINGKKLRKEEFVIDTPTIKEPIYVDKKGVENKMIFSFYNIRLNLNKVKAFLRTENAGLLTVALEYTYSSDWYTPDLGTWFIYIDSPLFTSDLFRNLDMDTLGEEDAKKLKEFFKATINDFFKARNKRFEKFLTLLENDKAYPYSHDKPTSYTQEILFKKVAYLVEGEHQILKKDDKIRNFLYPLIDKAIGNGQIEDIFTSILKLSPDNIEKFHALLQKTDLEDVVHFTNQVANKLEFLSFLHDLIYGEISGVLKERNQLHKIIEKELWLFGEAYNGTPKLWSDKQIGKILDELRTKYFKYEPSHDDDNMIDDMNVEGIKNITDLFFFNEKILDDAKKEILVVELKSPKCAISKKELSQIDDYAYTIESYSGLPKENVKYKLILISSKVTDFAKSKLKSARQKYDKPFLYNVSAEKDIEVYVMEWSELIDQNKRKLGYLSTTLKIKDKSVKAKFEKEYPDIIDEKVSARLQRIK